jgi:plastocyanin
VRRAALLALAVSLLAAAPAVARPAPARLLVEAREFNLTLSRAKIKPGTAIVQLANQGEDPHNLRITRIGGKRRGGIAKTLPGELGEWEGRLRRGRYRLTCTLEGHRALGMRATLRVR